MKIRSLPKWVKVAAPLLVTVVMLIMVSRAVDWTSFLAAIRNMSKLGVVLAFFIMLGAVVLQGVKYGLLLPELPLWRSVRAFMPGFFFFIMPLGTVTGPATVMMMLGDSVSAARGMSTLLIDMFIKFIGLLVLLLAGLALATVPMVWWAYAVTALILLLLSALLLALIKPNIRGKILRAISPLGKNFVGKKAVSLISALCRAGGELQKNKKDLPVQMVLGVICEALAAAPYFILGRAIGIDIPVVNWLWIHGLTRILCMVPLTVGGFGAREAALVLLLGGMDVPADKALTLSLIYSALNVVSAGVGVLLIFTRKSRRDKASPSAPNDEVPA